MRDEPTWRIPVGLLLLTAGLTAYAVLIAQFVPALIGGWHALLQTVVYLFLGLVWLLPLGRFLKWMETGRFR